MSDALAFAVAAPQVSGVCITRSSTNPTCIGFAGPDPDSSKRFQFHLTVLDIAVSGSFACATTLEGQVYCWGSNSAKGAPNGAPSSRAKPVAVRWPPL